MMNYVWPFLMLAAIITSFFTGKTEAVSAAALSGAGEGIKLCIELCGTMCFFSGLMEIAEKSGALSLVTLLLRPVTRILFPKLDPKSSAMRAITSNITANIFGMSNAATPLGLRAMEELQKLNPDKSRASDDMCMFALLNTASVQLIPSTVIALRTAAGSAEPTAIITPVWITSVIALTAGVAAAKLIRKRGES